MKLFAVIFLLGFINGHTKATKIEDFYLNAPNVAVNRDIGDRLKEVIEGFKEIVKNGNETFGIPAMDPYKLDSLNLSFKSDRMKGNLSLESADVSGTSNYIVNNADFKMVGLKMHMGLQWPKIEGGVTAYNFNALLLGLTNFYGQGDAEFTLRDLNVSIDLSFGLNSVNKTLRIKSMETELSLGSFKFYSEGIYNDPDLSQVISAIISDTAPKFIETYQKKLTSILNEIVMDIANDFLSTKTLKDLLDIIS